MGKFRSLRRVNVLLVSCLAYVWVIICTHTFFVEAPRSDRTDI